MSKSNILPINFLLVCTVFAYFIINNGGTFRYTGTLFIVLSITIFFYIFFTTRVEIPSNIFVVFMLLTCIIVVTPLDFEYSQTYTLINIYILAVLYFFSVYVSQSDGCTRDSTDILDGILYILLFVTSVFHIINSLNADSQYVIFPAIGDVNYTAVFIFMIFMIANKKKYISGIILAFLYGIYISTSRSFLLLMLLFYGVKLVKYLGSKNRLHIREHFPVNKKVYLFLGVVVLLGASIIFSYIWVYYVSNTGYVDHREGLNDVSNRMRFVSLVHAIEMIREDPQLFFWGCGSDLFDALGVYSDGTLPVYMGVRVVQPHNSLISLLLKLGVVPALLYFFLLCGLMALHFKKENLEYIIPYVINAMIMHSFFERGWLIFWIYILIMTEKRSGWMKTKKKKRFI